ncbi:chromate transporter [Clostridiales bacterium PH28_bin88]|nr:chromate transporter [Clostridiales bacterium PH28_bin88]
MLLNLFLTFAKISFFTIGGGYAMIPLLQKELVTVHRWINSQQMLDMLTVAEMTPGPIGINLATFAGYQTAGFWGAVMATAGIITPSVILVLALALFLSRFKDFPVVQAILKGIRPAVVSLIAVATFTVGQTALTDMWSWVFLACGLLASVRFGLHPILLLSVAGLLGVVIY